MGTGFLKRKKEAKMLQQQLTDMRQQMDNLEVEGEAANGLVKITLGGDANLKKILIKPECVDPEDVDGLQDLIKAAYQDAKKKLDAASSKSLPSGFPGF
jgi:DNA-binding YbaB/EbfC family protein